MRMLSAQIGDAVGLDAGWIRTFACEMLCHSALGCYRLRTESLGRVAVTRQWAR
jgi:hypothetical protein